jgi:hypothetical protein
MTTIPITDAIRRAAQDLLEYKGERLGTDTKRRLKAIADPASGRKVIDPDWWREVFGEKYVHTRNPMDNAESRAKLAKIKAMADPARNPNEPQRKVAEEMAAKFKPPKPPSAPGLEEHDRMVERRREAVRRAIEAIKLPDTPPPYRPPQSRKRRASAVSDTVAREGGAAVSDSVATAAAKPDLRPASDTVAEVVASGVSDSVRNANGYGPETPTLGERIMEHMRNSPPPPRVELICIDCGKAFFHAKPWMLRVRRCIACRNDAPRKRAAVANARRAAARAAARAGRKCEVCGKGLKAARSTARFCGPACRMKAHRGG